MHFLAGVLAAVAVGLLLKRRHFFGHRGGRWARRNWMLRSLFSRLETSPSQERVIEDEVSHILDALYAARADFGNLRQDVASAVRGQAFDESSFQKATAAQDATLGKVREAFRASLAKVHETLNDQQREALARLIERGPFGHGHHHRHRWV